MIQARTVIKALKQETGTAAELELVDGNGYWYFTYTVRDEAGQVVKFDTWSVYTMRLNDLPLDTWLYEGRKMIAGMEAE
jgi:hypothetical protein